MEIDGPAVEKEFRKELNESKKILGELSELTGGINPRSPKQVGEYLYDTLGFDELKDYSGNVSRTDAGGRKTDEATISALKPSTPNQRRFIALFKSYIPIKKRLETLTKLYDCSESKERIYAQFNQSVTATHRLSSSGRKYKVQFQNIDVDFKRLFKARYPGWLMGDADAPQLEVKVAGELGNDEQIKKDIREHWDFHQFTGSIMYRKLLDQVTKKERKDSKPDTFKPIFGGTSGTAAQRRYYRAFQEKYHQLFGTQTGWANQVLLHKELRIPSGLIFYWPDCHLDGDYITHKTEIFNYPIQSFATADIIPITLVYMWYRLRSLGARSFIVNTVHDSIVAEIHPEEKDLWEDIIKQAFTTDVYQYLEKVYNFKFSLPLGVGYTIADRWGEGTEELYELAA